MSDFQTLSKLLKSKPYLVVDSDLGKVCLVDSRKAKQMVMQNAFEKLFDSKVIMNVAQALQNYMPLTRTEDREFTLKEISTITATPYSKANLWVTEGIINPSIRAGDGPGKGKERVFSWGDSFVAGVCASLRRQGVGLAMLREVSKLMSAEIAAKPEPTLK